MPVLLEEKDYEPWLSGNAGLELLKPAAENVLGSPRLGFRAFGLNLSAHKPECNAAAPVLEA